MDRNAFVGILVLGVAGCLAQPLDGGVEPVSADFVSVSFTVTSASGTPVPYAAVSVFDETRRIAILSADAKGQVLPTLVPRRATHLEVSAHGHADERIEVSSLPSSIRLATGASDASVFRFLAHVPVACPSSMIESMTKNLQDKTCGEVGEPIIEVGSDGTIWVGATYIGGEPPIWTSRDGGASFAYLEMQGTDAARETCCAEGDFSIDDAGNVYFPDMVPFSMGYFSSWQADGTHRHTVPVATQSFIDRPWTRAGAEDVVHVIYNAFPSNATAQADAGYPADSYFFTSRDGGLTWGPRPDHVFPCALGNLGQGPQRERLFVTACATAGWDSAFAPRPVLWLSEDGGRSWPTTPEEVPMPPNTDEAEQTWIYPWMPSVADEAGNIYVAFTHSLDLKGDEVGVFLARRDVDGGWHGPFLVGPASGNALYPWPAAGPDGTVAVAWLHSATPNTPEGDQKAAWYLMAAASIDASAEHPHFQVTVADPKPTVQGDAIRGERGGSPTFLQADLTPDGRLAIAYETPSMTRQGMEVLFVQSDGTLDLGPRLPLYGPPATPDRP